MAVLDTLITTAAGALMARARVIVGGVVTRRAQDRQWLQDKAARRCCEFSELRRLSSRWQKAAHVEVAVVVEKDPAAVVELDLA
jgi:hypothetical protein